MNMPGFGAESSLGTTMGIYRGKAVFGRSGMAEVLPMQDFLASSILSQNLNFGLVLPPNRRIECCDQGGNCTTYSVPFTETCGCLDATGFLVCTRPFLNF